MRKTIYVALMCLLVAGCSINAEDITSAGELCEVNGGLERIRVYGTGPGTHTVNCKNGAEFDLNSN